jgi:hypothetical protein
VRPNGMVWQQQPQQQQPPRRRWRRSSRNHPNLWHFLCILKHLQLI